MPPSGGEKEKGGKKKMKEKGWRKGVKIGGMALVLALLVGGVFAVVNAQGQDSSGKLALDDKDPLLYDAQAYASNTGVSVDEALRRFQLQDIAGELDAKLSTMEVKTFAGLWIEHTPEFRIVVQFTRNGEETIKPYLEQYPEFADIVEVRTAKVSLAELQSAQASASSSVRASGVPVNSGINVRENHVELYVAKANINQFNGALQRKEIRLPDKVKVIQVETLAEDNGLKSPLKEARYELTMYMGLVEKDSTIGENIPTFGGMFIDENTSTLFVYVVTQEDGEKVRDILSPYRDDIRIEILQGKYTYKQMMEWRDMLRKLFENKDLKVTTLGIDQGKNILSVGLESLDERKRDLLTQELLKWNVPLEAVEMIETSPIIEEQGPSNRFIAFIQGILNRLLTALANIISLLK